MFRLATITARRARPPAASALPGLPVPFAPPPAAAAAVVSRRTAYQKQRPLEREIVVHERPLSAFKALHKKLDIRHSTPEQTYAIYKAGLKALQSKRSNPYWDGYFIYDLHLQGASAVHVHVTAVTIYHFNDKDAGEMHLFHHLLNFAAGMGYDASAMSHARFLLQTEDQKMGYFSYYGPAWAKTRDRVAGLIKQGRDANAVVLEGLIHMNRKTHKDNLAAIDAFRRAWNLGKATSHFDWEATCLESWGDIQLRLGHKEDAARTFRRLAELGYDRGAYRYAMMKPDDPAYAAYLTKAACSGMIEPMEPLINEHMRRSAKRLAEGEKKSADVERKRALEWSRILEYIKDTHRL